MLDLVPGNGNASSLPEPSKVNAAIPDNQLPPEQYTNNKPGSTLEEQGTTQRRSQPIDPEHTNGDVNGDACPAVTEQNPSSVMKKMRGLSEKVISGRFAKSKRPQLNARDLTFWDSNLSSEDMDTTSISDLRKTKSNTQSRRKKSNAKDEKRSSVLCQLSSHSACSSKASANRNSLEPNSTEQKVVNEQPHEEPKGASQPDEVAAAAATPQETKASKKAASRWGALRNAIRFQNNLTSKHLSHTDALREAKRYRTEADVILENLLNIQPSTIIAMSMQRDEHNIPRIPVILSQLKIRITDSEEPLNRSKASFRIELEYGDGLMKWVIHRQYRDFLNLHYSYRRYDPTRTRIKGLPKFPKHSLPYFTHYREEDDDSSSDEDEEDHRPRAARSEDNIALKKLWPNNGLHRSSEGAEVSRRPKISHHNTSFFSLRSNRSPTDHAARQAKFSMEQRRSLEKYLSDLTRCLMFRGEANRLCKFFEISALGIRLAAEGGYKGKEGYMIIERRSDQIPSAYRAAFCGVHIKNLHQGFTPKWFLVRHSFIACVDQLNSVSIPCP